MAASPTPTTNEARVWFVREDGLAPLTVPIDGENGAADLLVALAAGPPAGAGDGTLRTVARDPVTGNALASVPPDIEGGEADVASAVTVQLSPAFASLPSGEQILLLGQIVLTVTGSGIGFVAFVDDAGIPAAVPLPDGRLLDGPAKARDYASLIAQL